MCPRNNGGLVLFNVAQISIDHNSRLGCRYVAHAKRYLPSDFGSKLRSPRSVAKWKANICEMWFCLIIITRESFPVIHLKRFSQGWHINSRWRSTCTSSCQKTGRVVCVDGETRVVLVRNNRGFDKIELAMKLMQFDNYSIFLLSDTQREDANFSR